MRTQYEDERDEDIVPLTEEGLHEAAGEVRACVAIAFRSLFCFPVIVCCW